MSADNCGLPDGEIHMHADICYQAGRRDERAVVRVDVAGIEKTVRAAVYDVLHLNVYRPYPTYGDLIDATTKTVMERLAEDGHLTTATEETTP